MVSIVTCTNKDSQIDNVFDNYSRQKWRPKELIIILNGDQMNMKTWKEKASQYPNVKVKQLPAKDPLGKCLNVGVKLATHDYVAKFDDDDYYSPYYIPQAMKAFEEEKADLVGKKILYTYLKNKQVLGRRKSFQIMGGGTIMFRKKVFDKVQFPLKNHGEDTRFMGKARNKKFKIHITDPFNYVYIRYRPLKHTWKVGYKAFLRMMYDTIETDDFISHITRKPSGWSDKE